MMKVVDFERPGDPDVLRVKEVPMPTVLAHHVVIEVAATGLNGYDALYRRGAARRPDRFYSYLGYECSGTVVTVGSGVSEFKEGDEVCAFLQEGGGYAEFVLAPKSTVVRIPRGVSLVAAAALPLASCLSLYSLSELTKASPGKIILIHGAASGVGIIALQYAKHVGCKVFAIAGTEEKLRICKALGAEVCINYKKEDFCGRVKAETGGKGVDIIMDVNGGDYFEKNLECLAIGGSLVILGLNGTSRVNIDLSVIEEKDILVIGADLRKLFFTRLRLLMSNAVLTLWPLIEAGYIKPRIGKIFSFSQVTEAHRVFEEYNPHAGKLLLVPKETKRVL